MTTRKTFLIIAGVLIAVVTGAYLSGNNPFGENEEERISYNFHIRPILSDKCFACHGPDANKREAGLRLDSEASAFAPLTESKGKYAIVPGKPEQSELFRRISSTDPDYQMPTPDSHLGLLTTDEISLIKKWIKQGAAYEKHWAFTPPLKKPLPKVRDTDWPSNEIDYFVLKKLEKNGLSPNDLSDKPYLLKRVALDLTGLPPDLKMMDSFIEDRGSNAYEKMVDQLLASTSYGEKMAIMWLDMARYSDSYGYQDDNVRTQWPWRDWLIHAFNKNLPYDEFVTWQIAGDMLPDRTKEQILATAFLRNHKYTEEGGVIEEEYRVEYILDKTKTYSKGILGLTVECAQCHDHKYDPVSQEDYFRLYAFFNNTPEKGYEGDVLQSKPAKNPILTISSEEARNLLSFINKPDTSTLYVSVMGERDTLRPTYVLARGAYDAPGKRVTASAPAVVMKFDTSQYPKNRLGLARWTVDKRNPLTARVFVNLVWQEIFGQGLVKSSGDFGMQGNLPTHPDLLDWLAADFAENGWNIKRLMKQIVMSSTYRQSSRISKQKLATDPENLLLARGPRNRLAAENVRDLVLASSGLLIRKIGGPSVKPYQPAGLWEAATSGRGELATYKQERGEALYRRGIYTFIKLTVPPPSMMIFDGSNRDQCEVKRVKTNTPLQALVMMNDPTVMEASRTFAEKLTKEKSNTEGKIRKAFRSIVCRMPTDQEYKTLYSYFQAEQQALQKKKNGQASAREILDAGEFPHESNINIFEAAALMRVISLIYNMEETISKS